MDRKTRQLRKSLGYDVDETNVKPTSYKYPSRVFGHLALIAFVIGILGICSELVTGDYNNILFYFSLSFLMAPAILIYPVMRIIAGEGKTIFAAILSALFGLYVQESVKKKMKKWS